MKRLTLLAFVLLIGGCSTFKTDAPYSLRCSPWVPKIEATGPVDDMEDFIKTVKQVGLTCQKRIY